MKKLFILFFCILFSISLSACVPDKDDEPLAIDSPSIVEDPSSVSDTPQQGSSAPKGSAENLIANEPQESTATQGSI